MEAVANNMPGRAANQADDCAELVQHCSTGFEMDVSHPSIDLEHFLNRVTEHFLDVLAHPTISEFSFLELQAAGHWRCRRLLAMIELILVATFSRLWFHDFQEFRYYCEGPGAAVRTG